MKNNMDALVGSVLLHSLNDLPCLYKDLVNGLSGVMTPTPGLNITEALM